MNDVLIQELLKQHGLFTVGAALLGSLIVATFIGLITFYFNQRILGTREEKMEHIKADIEKNLSEFKSIELKAATDIQDAKWKLKYEACLKAMEIVDAFFSHYIKEVKGTTPVRQPADTIKARECYTKLALTCRNPKVTETFIKVMFSPKEIDIRHMTDNLNALRNAVRNELGFGEDINLNVDTAWFVRLTGDDREKAD